MKYARIYFLGISSLGKNNLKIFSVHIFVLMMYKKTFFGKREAYKTKSEHFKSFP